MKENYSYPLPDEAATEEIICVMQLWQAVEAAYEKGMDRQAFLAIYQNFKAIIKSIGEEKRLGNEFEAISGYSLYHTVQKAKTEKTKKLKMERGK